MNPKVSIIIPNYNHEHFLEQRLQSIFYQTYKNFEVILLDDCSTDNSQAILLEYAKHPKISHCVFNKTNSGSTFVQWRKGIELAKGEIIWIAESDDFCDDQFLETVIKPFGNDIEVVLAYCQSNKVNVNGEVTGNWKNYTDYFKSPLFDSDFIIDGAIFIQKYLIYKNTIPNASAVLMRKSKVLELGLDEINSNLKYCGDWLFYFKLLLTGKVAFTSKSLNNFRYHSQSVIAYANEKENKIELLNIDIQLRDEMQHFLNKINKLKKRLISEKLKKLIKELKYEKSLLLLSNKKFKEAITLIFSILFYFIRRYKLKNLFLKLKSKVT
ncbi:hypothetical protein GCM10023330_24230 [Litoribaculum gwangyangense]|uniref:Glycosyltransferase 2-like domain-containing protein n=2 Tax=Litoribaculum gwangyangense TaxID=1130722 RepID=A0ABP9CRY4_9FLAO